MLTLKRIICAFHKRKYQLYITAVKLRRLVCGLFTGHSYVKSGRKGLKTILKCKRCGHIEYVSTRSLQFYEYENK